MPQGTIDRNTDSAPGERALTVEELARQVEGLLEGDGGALIHGVSTIEEAESGDIVFAENARFLNDAMKSRASAIIAFLEATTPDKPLIKVSDPRFAFAKILRLFAPPLNAPIGIHESAVVSPSARIGERA